jgi:hypothetical protein
MATKTFTSGEVLTASDTNTFLANSGSVLIRKAVVGSGVSSVVVSNCFSATYENYRVVYSGGTASGSLELSVTLTGIASGYFGASIFASFGGGSASVQGYNNAGGFPLGRGNTGGNSYCWLDGEIRMPFLTLPTVATSPWMSGDVNFGTFTGRTTSTASATGFTMTCSSGSITGGNIYVYGYRN